MLLRDGAAAAITPKKYRSTVKDNQVADSLKALGNIAKTIQKRVWCICYRNNRPVMGKPYKKNL
jgi:hypothetical protein